MQGVHQADQVLVVVVKLRNIKFKGTFPFHERHAQTSCFLPTSICSDKNVS
jgi:hypothetical protein